MSAYANRLASIVLFVVLSSLMSSNAEDKNPLMVGLKNIKRKLERSEHFSLEELKAVSAQYHSWSEDLKRSVRSVVEARQVVDLALAPMQLDDPPKLSEIKEQFKRFRPIYRNANIFTNDFPQAIQSTHKLYKKLAGILAEPLELEDFVAAKSESLVHLKRMNKLAEEGLIYTHLGEFERLVNFFNRPRYKPMFVHVFPAMKHSKDVKALKKLFSDNLFICGFIEIHPIEKPIYRIDATPGFMHVV